MGAGSADPLPHRGGDGKLFDGADQPLVIDTADWDCVQHFPAPIV